IRQVFPITERENLKRQVSSRQLRSQLSAEQRSIGTRHAHTTSTIKEGPHQSLPFGQFLHLIQVHRRSPRGQLVDRLEKRGEVFRSKIEKPRVLQIAVERTLAPPHELRLQDALARATHACQHQGIPGPHRQLLSQLARYLRPRSSRRLLFPQDRQQCIS